MTQNRQIRIGNQTAFSAPTLLEPFRYAADKGFDAFEWFPDKKPSGEGWTEGEIKPKDRIMIGKIARDNSIGLSVHAPWQANPLTPEAYDSLTKHATFAHDIGATLMNIHFYEDKGIDAYIHAIRPLAQHLLEKRIQLAIENTPTTGPALFNLLFEKLHKTIPEAAGHIGMCLDLGHANLYQGTLNDYLGFIDRIRPHVPIIHVHMHENFGDADSHLTLFTGPAEKDPAGIMGVVVRLLDRGFSGAIILEQWPQPPALLETARNRLSAMIKERADRTRDLSMSK